LSPLLRAERRQHFVSRTWRALAAALGPRKARTLAAIHPSLDAEAAYQGFLARHETEAPRTALTWEPLVSVIVPVFDAPEHFLAEALQSVLDQTYTHWELCAADGGPTGSPGSQMLAAFSARDSRIRVVPLDRNRGIAGNSNAALGEARGEFVAFLDQDDLLATSSLGALVARLERERDLDLVYSDKDNVTPWGERYAPYFKPDWSPELFLSSNFVTHLCLVRRLLVDAAGGFDASMDGAQDWDLLLRVTEKTDRIAHVPRVLHHWRSLATSCASSFDAKPYAREAQRRTVQAHLDRRGVSGRVEVGRDGLVRIIPTASRHPPLSVVARGLSAVPGAGAYGDVEIVTDAAQAAGELLLFWDPGTKPVAHDTWLKEMAFWAMQPGIGAVGPLVRGPDGRIAEAGLAVADGRVLRLFAGADERRWTPLGLPTWYRNVLAPARGALMTRRDVFQRLGGMGADALDYALRAHRAGLRNLVVPTALMQGEHSLEPLPAPGIDSDPCFNPNLSPLSPIPRPRED
jgi:GT2 family glycosyltransferase